MGAKSITDKLVYLKDIEQSIAEIYEFYPKNGIFILSRKI